MVVEDQRDGPQIAGKKKKKVAVIVRMRRTNDCTGRGERARRTFIRASFRSAGTRNDRYGRAEL